MQGNTDTNYRLAVDVERFIRANEANAFPDKDEVNTMLDSILNLYGSNRPEFDRKSVQREVMRRFSIWQSDSSSIISNEGHVAWLTQDRKKDWRYWNRYRLFQEEKLPWEAVNGIDKSTDQILGLLEDPKRNGRWDRRGMVVGHVQSGKTGSYTGLICKAADAGYKIIIVLAGLHNNLRSQTQIRLDEGFLGYETSPDASDTKNTIGVGNIDDDPLIRPNYVTNRTDKGDFNTKAANNLGISPEQRPWLFVVKKNKSVLTNLHKWIQKHVANKVDPVTGKKVVSNLPLLLLDDEADNASVDTGKQAYTEDGMPDEEHSPTAINSLIRKILHTFERKAYVGYTATPFANIFIHERNTTKDEGPDLFPEAFIHTLNAPSNYIGPSRIFGLSNGETREGGLPLVRVISDHCSKDEKSGWMPPKHNKDHHPIDSNAFDIPDSLVRAINSFILTCAIRDLRGQSNKHSSMLIHVTRFTNVQGLVYEQVENYIRHLNQHLSRRIGRHVDILANLRRLWETDYLDTTAKVNEILSLKEASSAYTWQEIENYLPSLLGKLLIKKINGTAKDALDYNDSVEGLKVIAIGGDKLSRGLTLEGLCVSYFLRTTKMYDTLMQMGRWFGYRDDYLDLTRLYVTEDLVEWFEHISDAAEELREEFELMEASGATPREYGLKVKSHPELMITSRLKMQTAKSLYLSFSGTVSETVAFNTSPEIIKANYSAFETLINHMGTSGTLPNNSKFRSKKNLACWQNVPSEHILEFFSDYKTHPDSIKVNTELLRRFIMSMNIRSELTAWTVILLGGGSERSIEPQLLGGKSVQMMRRKKNPQININKHSIKRLLGSEDEALDLSPDQWRYAFQETTRLAKKQDPNASPKGPNGPAIRRVKGFGAPGIKAQPEKGLLILGVLDTSLTEHGGLDTNEPLIGFGVSFPGSNSGVQVEYKANNILWENEYDIS